MALNQASGGACDWRAGAVAVGLRARLQGGGDEPAKPVANYAARVCQACGSDHVADAYFCQRCGCQLRGLSAAERMAALRWQFRDVIVPLGFRHRDRASSRARVDAAVLAALAEYGAEGWQADGPTDFETLEAFERIRCSQRFVWWRWRDEVRCEAVTIRLKRLVV